LVGDSAFNILRPIIFKKGIQKRNHLKSAAEGGFKKRRFIINKTAINEIVINEVSINEITINTITMMQSP